ncbi:MAG: outer membrane lipoprotein-sorting protein [Candidatus Binatia bacterium]
MTMTTTRAWPAAVVGVLLWTLAAPGYADAGSALDLVKHVREATPKVPFFAKVQLSSDLGWSRDLELSHKHTGDVDASYMEVTGPMDLKDTRFLVLDRATGRDQQFIYVPAAKRSIQVGGQTRTQAFLGSEFAVADLAQPQLDEFTYRFVGAEDVNGRHCKLVEAVPKKPAEMMYSKSIMAIDPKDLVVVRTQLFDKKGKLQKVWTIEKLEKIDGVWTPVKQKMDNVQEHHWSRLELSDIKYNAELPDEMFQRSYLSR